MQVRAHSNICMHCMKTQIHTQYISNFHHSPKPKNCQQIHHNVCFDKSYGDEMDMSWRSNVSVKQDKSHISQMDAKDDDDLCSKYLYPDINDEISCMSWKIKVFSCDKAACGGEKKWYKCKNASWVHNHMHITSKLIGLETPGRSGFGWNWKLKSWATGTF